MITLSRIVLAGFLLNLEPFSRPFLIVYGLCGMSDVADGYLARKLNVNDSFGSKLDSIADVIFISVLLFVLITMRQWEAWHFGWVGVILLIRLISLVIGFIKYRDLTFIHTYTNKFTGFLLFLLPFLLYLFDLEGMVVIVLTCATVSSLEELLINSTSSTFSSDTISVFMR